MKFPALVPLICLLAGCASAGDPPRAETINRVYVPGGWDVEMYNEPGVESRTIPVSIYELWDLLPEVYEALGIPDAAGDPQRLLFGNPGYRPRRIDGKRLSTYVDCGSGLTATPNADQYEVNMIILTDLKPVEGSPGTVLTTTVDANARPRTHTGNPVHCQSKGTLELRVTQEIARALQNRSQ